MFPVGTSSPRVQTHTWQPWSRQDGPMKPWTMRGDTLQPRLRGFFAPWEGAVCSLPESALFRVPGSSHLHLTGLSVNPSNCQATDFQMRLRVSIMYAIRGGCRTGTNPCGVMQPEQNQCIQRNQQSLSLPPTDSTRSCHHATGIPCRHGTVVIVPMNVPAVSLLYICILRDFDILDFIYKTGLGIAIYLHHDG